MILFKYNLEIKEAATPHCAKTRTDVGANCAIFRTSFKNVSVLPDKCSMTDQARGVFKVILRPYLWV